MRILQYSRESLLLFCCPSSNQCAGLENWQIEAFADFKIFVISIPYTFQF